MKNKFMKILGIALTLAVLVGLMLPAMPASAGTLSWTNVDMPTQLTENTNLSLVTFAADGKTVYAYSNDKLIKSTDAGISWLPPDKVGEDLGTGIIALALSPRFATDSIVIAASADTFYYSNDAGKTFVEDQIDFSTDLPGDITSLAISYNWDDVLAIAIGTDAGVMVSIGSAFKAADMTDPTLEVAFAPDYASSDAVLALANGGDGVVIEGAAIAGKNDITSAGWDTKATFLDNADDPAAIDSAEAGFMAFPNNYTTDDNAIVFVQLSGYDAYRADLNAENNAATNLRLDKKSTEASFSLAYKGTAEDGTLAVGLSDKIWTSTNADTVDGAATWAKPKKQATGVDFDVVFSPINNNLYVASQNSGSSFGSAFSVSADLAGYNGLSRISVPSLDSEHINFSNYSGSGQATSFVVISNKMPGPGPAATYQILMKTTDSGKTWQEIFAEADPATERINGVSVKGDTIYLNFLGTDSANVIKKSTDGGNTFAPPITLRRNVDTLALIDADTYFYAANGQEIYKSTNDRTPVATLDTTYNIAVLINIPGFFVVKTIGGPVFFSADAVTFKQLGDLNPVNVAFDVPGRTVWAVDGDNVLWSFNVDTSTAWTKGKTINTVDDDSVSTISLSSDGSMYAIVTVGDSDNNTDHPQMYRSVDINAPASFEGIPDSSISALDSLDGTMQGGPGPVTLVSGTTGNTVYVITNLDGNPAAGKGLAVRVKTYTDTLVAGPTVIAPVANAQIPGSFTFQWSPMTAGDKKVTYAYQIATDDKFQGLITDDATATTKASTAYITNLTPGMSYFFRAKVKGVAADSTLSSKWSATVPFVVKLDSIISGGTGWIAPAAGTTDASQTPNFQWAAVPGATSYDLVIDGGSPISLTDTVYTLTTPLAYGSTHTWKVRAVANGNAGNWVSGIFTVKAAPTTTTPPPSTTPAPAKFFDPNSGQYFDTQAQLDAFQAQWKLTHTPTPTPATPAYIWVIIVIGAILVVAVIVLIARTRRV
jgi:hypothetical protein